MTHLELKITSSYMKGVELTARRGVVSKSICTNRFDHIMSHTEDLVFVSDIVTHEPLIEMLHTEICCKYICCMYEYIYMYVS